MRLLDTQHCSRRNRVFQVLHESIGESIELFHARFSLGDRLAIERLALERSGKAGNASNRRGRVLLATQVVEQSLDLDFDLMVSDLAPVDLVIQRAGRLHRHERGKRGEPVLILHGPIPDESASSRWLRDVLLGTAVVYPGHGQLWLTTKLLTQFGGFSMPDDALAVMHSENSGADQNW